MGDVTAVADSCVRRGGGGADEKSAFGAAFFCSCGPPKNPPNGLYCCCCCTGPRGRPPKPNGFQNCAAAGASMATLINATADALASVRMVVRDRELVRCTRVTSKRSVMGQYYDNNVNWKISSWLAVRAGIDRYFSNPGGSPRTRGYLHRHRLRNRSRIEAVAKPSGVAPTATWNARKALRVRGPKRPSASPIS